MGITRSRGLFVSPFLQTGLLNIDVQSGVHLHVRFSERTHLPFRSSVLKLNFNKVLLPRGSMTCFRFSLREN